MATDLTKMVEEWQNMDMNVLRQILIAMAEQIKGNTGCLVDALMIGQNLNKSCEILSERIDLLRKELKP